METAKITHFFFHERAQYEPHHVTLIYTQLKYAWLSDSQEYSILEKKILMVREGTKSKVDHLGRSDRRTQKAEQMESLSTYTYLQAGALISVLSTE